MSIYDLICPGCHSSEKIEHINSSETRNLWLCQGCQTSITTSAITREILIYRLKTTYKNIRYEGSFYGKGFLGDTVMFVFDYFDEETKVFCNIFRLSYHPNIDASSFSQKLPIWVLFS